MDAELRAKVINMVCEYLSDKEAENEAVFSLVTNAMEYAITQDRNERGDVAERLERLGLRHLQSIEDKWHDGDLITKDDILFGIVGCELFMARKGFEHNQSPYYDEDGEPIYHHPHGGWHPTILEAIEAAEKQAKEES